MLSDKEIMYRMTIIQKHREWWHREYGLVLCKRCGGSKTKVAEQSQEFHPGNTYVKVKLEKCWWCNDDGMVDIWNELMGKKWSDYAHKV